MIATDLHVPLVMLPGSMCDHRLFAHQLDSFGPSVIVGDLSSASSIEEMAASVLAAAPERFAVAGLSLGGIVAAEIAVQAPERLVGVAVLDTNLARPDNEQLERRAEWADRVRSGDFAGLVADELVRPMSRFPDLHGTLISDMALQTGADTFLQQNEALLHRRDRRDDLAKLSVPIIVAGGRDDVLCPPTLNHELVTRTAGAELIVIDEAGHLATIDQPEALTGVLGSWLKTCAETTTIHKGRT